MPLFWQSTSETGPLSTCQLILAPVRMLSVDARAITGLNGYQPSAVFLLDFIVPPEDLKNDLNRLKQMINNRKE